MRRSAPLLALCLLVGCDDATGTLVVQVRTDLPAGLELGAVRTRIEPLAGGETLERERSASAGEAWGEGVRVAELELPNGRYRLRVAALGLDGAVRAERPVRTDVSGGTRVVTVLLTQSCEGVECPLEGDDPEALACLGGRCVREECVEENPDACERECDAPSDCPAAPAPCATRECTASGTCFAAPDAARCESGEVCSLTLGCTPTTPMDGGGPDAGAPDAGAPDAGALDAGVCTETPCGLVPQCGCGPGEACYVSSGVAVCAMAGAGEDGDACAGNSSCAAGWGCEGDTGRCARLCLDDVGCAAPRRCAYAPGSPAGICVGDACDLVANTGCPAGQSCRIHRAQTETGDPLVTTVCSPDGTTARGRACVENRECAAGLECVLTPGLERTCRPFCNSPADCGGGDTRCTQMFMPPSPEVGHCSDGCDPLDSTAVCGAGRQCRLVVSPIVGSGMDDFITNCGPIGPGVDGDPCPSGFDCAPGFVCESACFALCDRDAPSCARGSCLGFGDPTFGGTRLGFCD